MAITPETLRLVAALRRSVDDITDTTVRDLTRAWVRAWDVIAGEVSDAVIDLVAAVVDGRWPARGEIERNARVTRALETARTSLTRLAVEALRTIAAAAAEVLRLAVEGQERIIASQLPAQIRGRGIVWNRLDPVALGWMVERTTQQIHSRRWYLEDQAVQAMKTELVRGIVVGSNPREAARRMVRRVEGAFNGGLARASNIARTEMLDAHRAGAKAAQDANAELLAGWVWLAKLNERTCASCWAKHGTVYPLDEPGPLDYQSGRCSRMPKTKTWAELGFEGIDEPDDFVPDARATFDALPRETKLAILGPARLRMLEDGEIDWADLSARRTTDGWRDSYGVTTVSDLRSGRRPSTEEPPAGGTGKDDGPEPEPGGTGGDGGDITPPAAAVPDPDPDSPWPYTLTPSGRPNLADLIPDEYPDEDARLVIEDAIKSTLEGTYAGLQVNLTSVDPVGNAIFIEGTIDAPSGWGVGSFERNFQRGRDGKLYADHAYLSLDEEARGQGFATEFNDFLYSWYEESGFDRVQVHADIDVGGYCVPTRARILTRGGWKKHDEIAPGDETLGYDFATGTLRWTPITGVATFDSLPMWRLEHRNWVVEATPNHRWVVQRLSNKSGKAVWLAPEFLTTQRLDKHGRRIIVAAPLSEAEDDRSGLTPDEAALLAWLVTDGNVHRRRRRGYDEVTASIAQEKPAGRAALEALMQRLGGARMNPRGCNVPARVLRALYGKLGVPYGDPLEEHLEGVVLRMGAAQLASFCEAGMVAEGDRGRARFWQKPGAALEAFRLAFYLTGHRVSGGVRDRDVAWATICRPHVTSERLRITAIGHEPAWCPQTGLGTWVMELDGHIMLTGNTWATQGFTFADQYEAAGVLDRLRGEVRDLEDALERGRETGYLPPSAVQAMEAELVAAREILDRAKSHYFGAPGYPTAYEVSQAGRLPGQSGRDATWIGKRAMLGSDWHGVKWLNAATGEEANPR